MTRNTWSRPQTLPSYEWKQSGESSQISCASTTFCNNELNNNQNILRPTCSNRIWTNFTIVRKLLRNNHQSHNLVGHYHFWVISPTLFTTLFLAGRCTWAGTWLGCTITLHYWKNLNLVFYIFLIYVEPLLALSVTVMIRTWLMNLLCNRQYKQASKLCRGNLFVHAVLGRLPGHWNWGYKAESFDSHSFTWSFNSIPYNWDSIQINSSHLCRSMSTLHNSTPFH